jgi:hypothetical protein
MKKVILAELKNPVTSNISDELSGTALPAVVGKAVVAITTFIINVT